MSTKITNENENSLLKFVCFSLLVPDSRDMQIDIEVHDAETDANLGFVTVSFDRDGEIVISDKAGNFPVDAHFLRRATEILDAMEKEECHPNYFWTISI